MKKIAYVSGGRMDFGLMLPVLKAINKSSKLQLQVYYTGVHLMKQFGETWKLVKKEFPSAKAVKAVFETDDNYGMAKFAGKCTSLLVEALSKDKPDITLTLGDRAEMLSMATASVYLGIPSAQVHAGDKTFHVDEFVRHAISKLSHLFFAATKDSAVRLEKLGEEKWRIHLVGAPALDFIKNEKLFSRHEVCKKLGLDPKQKFILIVQHPVSSLQKQNANLMEKTIKAVKYFRLPVIVVYPNADAEGREMIKIVNKENKNPLFYIFPNLEFRIFLSLEKEASVFITNSSSGRIEAAAFATPVVNLGIRQLGRPFGKNVINVGHNGSEIIAAVKKSLFDKKYLKTIKKIKNPWGKGNAAKKIVKVLEKIKIDDKLLTKQIVY